MMRTVLTKSSSPEKTFTVQTANPEPAIINAGWPGSPKREGETLEFTVEWKNDGGDGTIFIEARDSEGLLDIQEHSVAAGESGTSTLLATMPGTDIQTYLRVGTGDQVTDERGPYNIELLREVGTSLTLNLGKSTAAPGESISWSGKLSRDDAEDPGEQEVRLMYSLEEWAATTTDSKGVFSSTFTTPQTEGTYYLDALFEGATIRGTALAPSSSSSKKFQAGIIEAGFNPIEWFKGLSRIKQALVILALIASIGAGAAKASGRI